MDSQPWGSRLESAGSGSSAHGQSTLISLPIPLKGPKAVGYPGYEQLAFLIARWNNSNHTHRVNPFTNLSLPFILHRGGTDYWGILVCTFNSHSRVRVRILPSPGTFVLQQDILSTLLLSTQVYKWGSCRMWLLVVDWCRMCASLKWRLARISPGSQEGSLYECRNDVESPG